jgi:hypothetical protein
MPDADLIPDKPRKQAEILDVVQKFGKDEVGSETLITHGGLTIPLRDIADKRNGIDLCVLQPVTKQGEATLEKAKKAYELNFDPTRNPSRGPRRNYVPVTTLQVDSNPAAGGKRNKSKKPKPRNSRSKRRKTVSKRRR